MPLDFGDLRTDPNLENCPDGLCSIATMMPGRPKQDARMRGRGRAQSLCHLESSLLPIETLNRSRTLKGTLEPEFLQTHFYAVLRAMCSHFGSFCVSVEEIYKAALSP